jgi:hypothetical protein
MDGYMHLVRYLAISLPPLLGTTPHAICVAAKA